MADLITEIDSVAKLPGGWLQADLLKPIDESEASDVASEITPKVVKLLSEPSAFAEVVAELFHPQGFWRDQVGLTWSLRTFHTSSLIVTKLQPMVERARIDPASVKLLEDQVSVAQLPNGVSFVRVPYTFTTSNPAATCSIAFKLVRMSDTGDLKVFTVTSALKEVHAKPWGPMKTAPTADLSESSTEPSLPDSVEVLVIGAGHGGLAISAYLKALGIVHALVDKEPTIGDAWGKRYDSTTLHTTRVFSGLPFFPFPSDYPLYVPAPLIAKHYSNYAKQLGLPAFPGRTVQSSSFDEGAKEWTTKMQRADGSIEVIRAKNLVFSIGVGGRWPVIPDFPGKDSFRGEQLHSASYQNPSKWKGKKVAVIGASTTSCDVCHDCSKMGIDVTMIQRGPTRIYPSDHITQVQLMFWNDKGGADLGDVITSEDPVVLQAALSAQILKELKDRHNPQYYAGLKKAGFLAAIEGAIHEQIYCHGGRHYPDIGACAAISAGEIKVKSGSKIDRIEPDGIRFDDGSKVVADVIVYATGFLKDNRHHVADVIGKDLAYKLEPVWGLNAEGEARGVWKPTGHDRVWFQGGELQTMRYYGRFLALQIAAEVAGVRPEPLRN